MDIYHIFVDLLVSVDETCYQYWIVSNSILLLWWEKLFVPHSVSVDMRGWEAPQKRIFRTCKDFPCFSLWFDCIGSMIPKSLPNNSPSCYCNSATFSLSMVFIWYCEFMKHPKTLNLLWYVMASLLCLRNNTISSILKSNSFTEIWTASSSTCFASSRIFHNFSSGPLTSLVLFCSYSKTFSRFCSLVFFFSFKRSLRKSFNFFTVSTFFGTGLSIKLFLSSLPRG